MQLNMRKVYLWGCKYHLGFENIVTTDAGER